MKVQRLVILGTLAVILVLQSLHAQEVEGIQPLGNLANTGEMTSIPLFADMAASQPIAVGTSPQCSTFSDFWQNVKMARAYPGAFNQLGTPSQAAAISANGENPLSWTLDGTIYWFGDDLLCGDIPSITLSPIVSYETHIAGNDKSNQNSMQFRAGLALFDLVRVLSVSAQPAPRPNPLSPNYVDFETNVDYNVDKEFETQELTSDNYLSLNFRPLQIIAGSQGGGSSTHASDGFANLVGPVSLNWKPLLGFQIGQVLRRPERDSGQSWFVLRPTFKLNAEVDFTGLAQRLKMSKLDIFVNETALDQPVGRESPRFDNYVTAGVEIQITKNYGFQFAYNYGQAAPTFLKTSGLTLGISGQF